MSSREILSTRSGSRQQIRGLLESLFIAELLYPSPRIYLVSAWVRDIPLIDNRSGGFRGLDPSWERRTLRLAEVLAMLVERGSSLVLATRPDRKNKDFVERVLRDLGRPEQERVSVQHRSDLHIKGLLGRGYAITGSMNFTNNGVFNNEELLRFDTDPQKLAELGLNFEQAYGVSK